MSLYKPINVVASDQSVINPAESAVIYNKNPVYIGPKFSDPHGIYRIENFATPVFQPSNVPQSTIQNQASGFNEETCPIVPILLRNEWETMNTTNAKIYGGFDKYSIQNIPSCSDRNGPYMNFLDSTRPWSRAFVNGNHPDNEWVIDSHGRNYNYQVR